MADEQSRTDYEAGVDGWLDALAKGEHWLAEAEADENKGLPEAQQSADAHIAQAYFAKATAIAARLGPLSSTVASDPVHQQKYGGPGHSNGKGV